MAAICLSSSISPIFSFPSLQYITREEKILKMIDRSYGTMIYLFLCIRRNTQVWLKGSVLKTERGVKARGGSNPSSSFIKAEWLVTKVAGYFCAIDYNPNGPLNTLPLWQII